MNHGKAASARYSIIHVMGDQTGEAANDILKRKRADAEKSGMTLWAQHSRLAKPDHVRSLCAKGEAYLYLVADRRPAGRIKMPGQQTTGRYRAATHYNAGARNVDVWEPVAELNISDVVDGCRYLDKGSGYALVLGVIEILEQPFAIRMQEWANNTGEELVPVKTGMGYHAICAERHDMSDHPDVWTKERMVIATAPLVKPFAVWLR
jgi:hypothetical protein